MFEVVIAVLWWPMVIGVAVFAVLVGYVLIEALLDWVLGKQSRGQKWSRK